MVKRVNCFRFKSRIKKYRLLNLFEMVFKKKRKRITYLRWKDWKLKGDVKCTTKLTRDIYILSNTTYLQLFILSIS